MKKVSACHHFTHMLPEIRSETDIMFCHFGPCFALSPQYWRSYDDIRHDLKSFFCHFRLFLPFWPSLQAPKPKFWKNEDIILHMCTTNDDRMMYSSWDIKKSTWSYHYFRQVYRIWQSYDVWFLRYEAWQTKSFAILGHFMPFYHPNSPEN